MGMKSALIMMARIVTMLACLILVPLAALFGTALPDVIRDKLAGPAPRVAHRSDANRVSRPAATSPDQVQAATSVAMPAPERAPQKAPQRTPLTDTAGSDLPEADRLLGLLQRLQHLGAVHYRLERSAEGGGQYWFHCDVPGSRQPFVASDTDPVRTTERVVKQVEAWRASVVR
jgi:hypothetical protein